MKKYLGKFVKVTFDDHVIGNTPDGLLECWAIGEVFSVDEKCMTLRYWGTADEDGSNEEYIRLLRSGITNVKELK